MKHLTEVDCVDFANRTASASRLSEMQEHLDKGCSKCQKELRLWQDFKEFARRESECSPTEEAVRLAVGAFAVSGPRPRRGVFREIAQLVFDSLREPVLAGVRGGPVPSRRLMFRAGEIMIDLSLQSTSRPRHVLLVGQVLDTATSGVGIGRVPVVLLNGRDTLAQVQTNPYGEFQMECMENKNLQISVGVTENKDVFIPLDESIWKTPAENRIQ